VERSPLGGDVQPPVQGVLRATRRALETQGRRLYGAVARKLLQIIYGVLKTRTHFKIPETTT
ncbi:MAG: hypothetical protein ACR2GY_00705, partial [Phycisphaerales bacterium]